MFFRGNYNLSVDAKGRIAIPKKFREYLVEEHKSTLIIALDLNAKCLALYPYQEWRAVEDKIMALPNSSKSVRALQRIFVGRAVEQVMDGQGRILVTKEQLGYAEIAKESTLVGQGKKFELWDRAAWDATCDDILEEIDLEEMSELLGDLSF
ncbi:division/cell wall cluster transcriptional repressor MraZ [Thiomicrorhabdus sp. 6S3-12]|uniref:division/cell wall cluster transcriptional repressor MraZ n=1 Tax=Thiomicrorhabdus sp. 6S3-12 TaxID=2819681 RepID=UPI003530122E